MRTYTPITLTLLLFASNAFAASEPAKVDVFTGGVDGYHTYRIPALVVSNQGTALAFCEARKDSPSDQGNIDLVLRRSTDGGLTWGPMQLVHEVGGNAPITIGNPAPIVTRNNNTVHLLFTQDNRRLFYTQSADDGLTWAVPIEHTDALKMVDFPWVRIATGPVHGIQRQDDSLLVTMWFCDAEPHAKEKRYRAGVLLGDTSGTHWRAGGLVAESIPRLNECTVLERRDGALYLNMRAYKAGYRAISESTDGGRTWSEPTLDKQLPDPTCQGSALRLKGGPVLFANIPAEARENISLRVSRDEGKAWSPPRRLEEGPSAYSDLAECADGTILCLYERGTSRYNEKITLARIHPDWLTANED